MKDTLKSRLVNFAKKLDDFDGFGNPNNIMLESIKIGVLQESFNQLVLSKQWTKESQEAKDTWLRQYNTLSDLLTELSDFLYYNRDDISKAFSDNFIRLHTAP